MSADILRPDPKVTPVLAEDVDNSKPGVFEIVASQGDARSGRLWTAHGAMETPAFMPVGTYGAVKGLLPSELRDIGSQTILGNAYHLGHRPGPSRFNEIGGLHNFMGWHGPILTDSGGYQVFSLRGMQKIDNDGVDYRDHLDGSKHRMTPRTVLEGEAALNSDICMILDHCPPGDASTKQMKDACDRTTKWAREAADMRREVLNPGQLCFGIVQGGTNLEMRRAHLATMRELDFDGLALGGLSVGEPVPEMHATMRAIGPEMPEDRPRYVMGIGTPRDLLVAVSAGIDMFDCVMPTRHARNGQLFTYAGKVNLRRSEFRHDDRPVDAKCGCVTCQNFSRAYLRHLHDHRDPLYVRLATTHNLFFYHQWVAAMRLGLRENRFTEVTAGLQACLDEYYPEESPPPEA